MELETTISLSSSIGLVPRKYSCVMSNRRQSSRLRLSWHRENEGDSENCTINITTLQKMDSYFGKFTSLLSICIVISTDSD